jgi:NTE family protein
MAPVPDIPDIPGRSGKEPDLMNRRKLIGLALSGGAARGAAHLGVLRILEREKIPIDMVAGTSTGSIVGACYCAGIGVEKMVTLINGLHWRHIARPTLPVRGLFTFRKLEDWLVGIIGDRQFTDMQRPLAVMVTDLMAGTPLAITQGRVASAVHASCAVPGLVVPVAGESTVLGDGGVTENLPVRALRNMGADAVIGIDLLKFALRRNRGPVGFALTALEILLRRSGGGLESADVLIVPALENKPYVRFSRSQEMIALGELAAEQMMPQIRAILGETKTQFGL